MKESALKMVHKNNSLGVVAIIIVLFLAAIDSTIVSTVLPSISRQLGHPTLYPWIMTAFLLPVALVAPLAGVCADKLGISATLKACVLLFLAASVLAALSPSMPVLISARALQGIGAGGIIVLSYSLLATLFDAKKRGKMQGILSGVWGISAISGPLFGSLLDGAFGWRTIFWFNIPVGLLALIFLFMAPTVGKRKDNIRFDLLAQLLLIVLACGLLLLITQPESIYGVTKYLHGITLVTFLLLAIRVRQKPESSPIPLQFLQQRALFSIIILVLLSSAGLYASVTLLPLALSDQVSTTISAGLFIMLAALGWVLGAALCGSRLVTAGYKRMVFFGMLLLAVGTFMMAHAIEHGLILLIAVALLFIGLGMGFVATTTLVFTQNSAPTDRLATWTATIQFLRNLGAALGVNTLATAQLHLPSPTAFQTCFIILGLTMLVGLLFSFLLPREYSAK